MTRTDIHRPSAIIPADYDFVAMECVKIEGFGDALFLQAQRKRIEEHMARTGGERSRHEHGGTCHICGSVNAIYTALFHHRPSNVYVRVGTECAEKLEYDSGEGETFRRQVRDARERAAGKAKAQAVLSDAGLSKAWELYMGDKNRGADFARDRDMNTLCDIVSKLVQYGSLSDAQLRFVGRLVSQIENRPAIEAQRKAERDAAAPVPVTDKRVTVRGKVLTIRQPDDYAQFPVVRILVQHADGWKVWGSLPSSISGVGIGQVVQFDAAVKVSDKDEKFGFFSRPTKAKILEAA